MSKGQAHLVLRLLLGMKLLYFGFIVLCVVGFVILAIAETLKYVGLL